MIGVAGYYGLYLVPVLLAPSPGPFRAYWFASGIAAAALLLWLRLARGGMPSTAKALNAMSVFGNVLLAISLYVQGTGFNVQFLHHVDLPTMQALWGLFGTSMAATVSYWAATCLWFAFLGARAGTPPAGTAWRVKRAAAVVGIAVLNVPLVSFADYAIASIGAAREVLLVPKPARTIPFAEPGDAPDLVVVVAESLEATYGRADIFGRDLTPRLTALAGDGIRFSEVRQVSDTGWTTAGLVAAFCAEPVAPGTYFTHANTQMLGATCIGDVLSGHGYRTVYMGGAPLSFAGKGRFLAAHGFQERHGFGSFRDTLDPSYLSGWGLYDDTLLTFVRSRLHELAASATPFALVVLTADTHYPPSHPSASCGPRTDPRDEAFTIGCADKLLAEFIAEVRMIVPEAVVVLFSDHLAMGSLKARPGLMPTGRQDRHALIDLGPEDKVAPTWLGLATRPRGLGVRRLRFAIWDARRDVGVVDRPGTHFDIMPTVLDALGFGTWSTHAFGTSLFRAPSPWLSHPDAGRLRIVREPPDVCVAPDAQVAFSARGPTLEIGGVRMLATGRGLGLDNAAFAIAFDRRGCAERMLRTSDVETAFRKPSGTLVGLSAKRSFNERLLGEEAAELVYFVGHPSADLVVGPLTPPHGRIAVPFPGATD